MQHVRITLLGTGTCQLEPHRMAASALVDLPGLRFVFDFGRGITMRLAQLNIHQDDLEHIIISHTHPDHLEDLIPYLHAANWSRTDARTKDLHVYGPPGIKKIINAMCSLFGHGDFQNKTFGLHIHECTNKTISINDYPFDYIPLPHCDDHGIKFSYKNHTIAFTGDTILCDQEIDFLTGVDCALIDAGHLSEQDIITLACQSQAGHIICSHLYTELDQEYLQQAAAKQGFRGTLRVPKDLECVVCG